MTHDQVLCQDSQRTEAARLAVSPSSIIITYVPEHNKLSIEPVGLRRVKTLIRSFAGTIDGANGAKVYILDGMFHTTESVATLGEFSLSATSHRGSDATTIHGPVNIKAFEKWLTNRGDLASAEVIRDFFPKIFAPTVPVQEATKKRRWWRR